MADLMETDGGPRGCESGQLKRHEHVDHPAHYQTAAGIEAIDVIEAFGLSASWHLGDAMKYLLRAGHKGYASTDLRKAEWYVRRWRHLPEGAAGYVIDAWWRGPATPLTVAAVVRAFGLTGPRAMAVRGLLWLNLVSFAERESRAAYADEILHSISRAIVEADAKETEHG